MSRHDGEVVGCDLTGTPHPEHGYTSWDGALVVCPGTSSCGEEGHPWYAHECETWERVRRWWETGE